VGRLPFCLGLITFSVLTLASPNLSWAESVDPFRSAPGPAPLARSKPRPPSELASPPPVRPVAPALDLSRVREFAAAQQIPLPPDLQITPPRPEISPSLARFSGVWSSNTGWGGRCRKILLAVEKIEPGGQAIIVTALGPSPPNCYRSDDPAYFSRLSATIRDDTLEYLGIYGVANRFKISGDRYLMGTSLPSPSANPPNRGGGTVLISRID
jgi:hypothetical protein